MTTYISAAALIAVGILVLAFKARLNYLRLPALPPGSLAEVDVTVIIPARNEAANIARVVSSFPDVEVVVVDDASTDGTSDLARAAGAQVIAAPALPQGQLGKPNACNAGALASLTEWLLFVDADTWYEPGFAGRFIAYAQEEKLEMVSAFLRQHTESFFEHVLLPYAFALYFTGVNADQVNSAVSRQALANGQCLLVRRDTYRKLGGHAAVATSIIEDVALARLAKKNGVGAYVIRAEDSGHVRMYDGLGAIWRGFEKNSFRFLLVNPLGGAIVIAASIVFTSYLPLLVLLALGQDWLMAIGFALLPGLALLPWYRGPRAILLTPIAIYLFQLIALSGMWKTLTRGKTTWKGRPVG
ncbi:MAG: glycosyltransferase [Bryobacterales bacterium]|nr:glycosyltransferase [Bryobacterales bacterium]